MHHFVHSDVIASIVPLEHFGMTASTNLTDVEVAWLAHLHEALGVGMPREIEVKLLRLGLVQLCEIGTKVSAEGEVLLKSRWARTRERAAATRRWTHDVRARVKFERERAKMLVEDARSRRASENGEP
jgi:hypothetical protein